MSDRSLVNIFVSSVFRDMHAERDLLNRFVMPELEQELRNRGRDCTVQWVDLRWGLETVDAAEHMRERYILEVCLEEIDRAKPFFLCLLGQAYGTEADDTTIEALAQEFSFALDGERRGITDVEVQFALYLQSQSTATPIFFFREASSSESDDRRMVALKSGVSTSAPQQIAHYKTLESPGDVDKWIVWITDQLVDWLEPQIAPPIILKDDPTSRYEGDLASFLGDVSDKAIPRKAITAEVIERLVEGAKAPGTKLFLLSAPPGAGKTTIAAGLPTELNGRGFLTLTHFVALSDRNYLVDPMLHRFCDHLCEAAGLPRLTDDEWSAADSVTTFSKLLNDVCKIQPVAIIVDTPEDMELGPRGQLLTWWPRAIDGEAVLLATCRNAESIALAWGLDNCRLISVPDFSLAEATQHITAMCARRRRHLPRRVLDAIVAKKTQNATPARTNPLWVTLLVEELNLLDARDFELVTKFSGDTGTRIEQLLLEVIGNAPAEAGDLYGFVFERMERTLGVAAVSSFVSLLSVTRSGLRPADLLSVMSSSFRDEGDATPSTTPLLLAQLRHRLRGQLVTSGLDGNWHFRHAMASTAGRARYIFTEEKLRTAHSAVASHLLGLPLLEPLRIREASFHLWKSGRTLDFSREVIQYGSLHDAHTLLDAVDSDANDRLDVRRLLADQNITANEATQLARFMSEEVASLAERRGTVASQVDMFGRIDVGLSDRVKFQSPAETELSEASRAHIALLAFSPLNAAGQNFQAYTLLRNALPTFEALAAKSPNALEKLKDVCRALEIAGHSSLDMNEFERATEQLTRCVEIARRLVLLNPRANYHATLGSALAWLGIARLTQVGAEAALPVFEEALSEYRIYKQKQPDGSVDYSLVLEYLLDIKCRLGDLQGALDCGEELVGVRLAAWELDPGDLVEMRRLASARTFLGMTLAALGKRRRAEMELELSIKAMLIVLTVINDDALAFGNLCASVSALDLLRLTRLSLTSSTPYAAEISNMVRTVGAIKGARTSQIPMNFVAQVRRFTDAKLLTAAEICMSRAVWWISRLRGECDEPSHDAGIELLSLLGETAADVMRLKAELDAYRKAHGDKVDGQIPPAFLTPIDIEVCREPLNLKDFASAVTGVGEPIFAAAHATISMQAGHALNALRWVQLAEPLVERVEAIGVTINPDTKKLLSVFRSELAGLDDDNEPSDDQARRGRIGLSLASRSEDDNAARHPANAEASEQASAKLAGRLGAFMGLAAAERQSEALIIFRDSIVLAKGELGSLLRESMVAEELINLCVAITPDLRAMQCRYEADFALRLAADVAIGLGDEHRTESLNNNGLYAITLLYDSFVDLDSDHGLEVELLRSCVQFATKIGGRSDADTSVRYAVARLQTLLARVLTRLDDASREAETLLERSAALRESIYLDNKDHNHGIDASSQWNAIAEFRLRRGEVEAATVLFEKALTLRRRLLAEAAGNLAEETKIEYFVAGSLTRLADVRIGEGDFLSAASCFVEAERIRDRRYVLLGNSDSSACVLLWWARSRAADCFLDLGDIENGVRWSQRSNAIVGDVYRIAPAQLDRLLSGVSTFIDQAVQAAAQSKFELWRAWIVRATNSLRALQAVGAPLGELAVLLDQAGVSNILAERPPPPLATEVTRAFEFAAMRDLTGLREQASIISDNLRDGRVLANLARSLELEESLRIDEAARLLTTTLQEYDSSGTVDQRVLTEVNAHRMRLLDRLNIADNSGSEREFVHMSALVLFGPGSQEVTRVERVMRSSSA